MTKRFSDKEIHELMMKTSTDYAVNEKFGMHDIVDGLEGLVGSRMAERERIEAENERMKVSYAESHKRINEEKEPSQTPPPQSRERRSVNPAVAALRKAELEKKGYDTFGMSESEMQDKFSLEGNKDFLRKRGYDPSRMGSSEIESKADQESKKKEKEEKKYLESKGYNTSSMSSMDVMLNTFSEKNKR